MPILRLAVLLSALANASLGAQVPRVALGKGTTLLGEFSQIRGLRELPDGRVIVADRLEEAVSVVDFTNGKRSAIGRSGRGPREYHLPTALAPMPGDSTLLSDEGNSRLSVIGPDLRIHRSFTLQLPGMQFPVGARAVDADGRFYLQVPGWLIDAKARGDSVPVVRFDPATRTVDTVAIVKGSTSPPPRDGRQMGIPFVPFSPQDVWSVSRDGRLAVVRSNDYHVEWRAPNGMVQRGPTVALERIRVLPRDKVAYTRQFLANSNMSGRGPDGSMGATPAEFLTEERVRTIVENNAFAETMGPFTTATPHIAPGGDLWVERATHVGLPSTWDRFDTAGRLTRQVDLPAGRRLLLVSQKWIYLAAVDGDGVETLERYAVPR